MDGFANFNLLRERLQASEKKMPLFELELLRMNALEEHRKFAQSKDAFSTNGVFYYCGAALYAISAEERERTLFSLGQGCLQNVQSNIHDGFFDHHIVLCQLHMFPHCAMLSILAMIENITDGCGAPQLIPPRYHFRLLHDVSQVFQRLIEKIPLFYPGVSIGRIEAIESPLPPPLLPPTLVYEEQFLFAVDRLVAKQSIDRLVIRDYLFKAGDDTTYDFKTMTAMGKKYLVAFSDLDELNKGPSTAYLCLALRQAKRIVGHMPFDGVVFDPFNVENRKVIEKNEFFRTEKREAEKEDKKTIRKKTERKDAEREKTEIFPEKRKLRGKRLVFLILTILFGIGILETIVMFLADAAGANLDPIPVPFLFILYSFFAALFFRLFRKEGKES